MEQVKRNVKTPQLKGMTSDSASSLGTAEAGGSSPALLRLARSPGLCSALISLIDSDPGRGEKLTGVINGTRWKLSGVCVCAFIGDIVPFKRTRCEDLHPDDIH